MQQCPICRKDVFPMQRYPNYVCSTCIDNHGTRTWDGRTIKFYNQDHTGGFISQIEGLNTHIPVHQCYINGVECWADEARFGGIVIQPTHQQTLTRINTAG